MQTHSYPIFIICLFKIYSLSISRTLVKVEVVHNQEEWILKVQHTNMVLSLISCVNKPHFTLCIDIQQTLTAFVIKIFFFYEVTSGIILVLLYNPFKLTGTKAFLYALFIII